MLVLLLLSTLSSSLTGLKVGINMFPFKPSSLYVNSRTLPLSLQSKSNKLEEESDLNNVNAIKNDLLQSFDSSNSIPMTEQDMNVFVCPESLGNLSKVSRYYGFSKDEYYQNEQYDTKYPILSGYIDFTIKTETDRPLWSLTTRELIGSRFFQNPLISSIYERGYRQNFERAGFPGPQKEFEEALTFFMKANATGILMDLSCGSGFMSRKFVGSDKFQRIISADLSPTMLRETKFRFKQEALPLPTLVRCDSASLPFKSNSIDAIHAGAAMHCWPRLELAISEIYRVLKPGGVFYTSTFITNVENLPESIKNSTKKRNGYNVFESCEDLYGYFQDWSYCIVRKEGNACAIIKAGKALDDNDSSFQNLFH